MKTRFKFKTNIFKSLKIKGKKRGPCGTRTNKIMNNRNLPYIYLFIHSFSLLRTLNERQKWKIGTFYSTALVREEEVVTCIALITKNITFFSKVKTCYEKILISFNFFKNPNFFIFFMVNQDYRNLFTKIKIYRDLLGFSVLGRYPVINISK